MSKFNVEAVIKKQGVYNKELETKKTHKTIKKKGGESRTCTEAMRGSRIALAV